MTIVAALCGTRARFGRTLAAVAARAGITESNLSTIEHNRRSPRCDTIDRLAAALDVTLVPAATGGRNTAAEAGTTSPALLPSGTSSAPTELRLQLAGDLGPARPYVRLLLAAEAPPRSTPAGMHWLPL